MKIKQLLTIVALALGSFGLTGCPNQQSIASLVTVLGSAAGSIAALEGNANLAERLRVDTAAAAAAVANWKKGTPAQQAIEALNLVMDDLNLFPLDSKYAILVTLAIGTAQSIIAILAPAGSPGFASPAARAPRTRPADIGKAPKTAEEFKARWNAQVQAHPELAQAALK